MGIDIELEAKLPSAGIFSTVKSKIDWEAALLASLKETMGEYGLAGFIPEIDYVANGRLPLNYCEEWADVSSKDGRLVVATRTSTCGPGYHAAFCAGIDDFARKFKVTFNQTTSTGDETGYFVSRDYSSLQNYFANWLKHFATNFTKDPNAISGWRLQLPLEQLTPDGKDGEIFTPRGPVNYPDLQRIADAEYSDSLNSAKNWFPWWDERLSSDDYLKLASQVMWTEIPWHAPANSYETHLYKAAISSIQKAKALGANATWLDDEYNEMLKLLDGSPGSYSVPSKSGIGYRRHDCRWSLAPSWTGLLPGYLFEIFSEDNYQLHFDNFAIRLTSFSVPGGSDDFLMPPEQDENEIVATGKTDQFAWRIEDLKSIDENGWKTSFVYAASKNSILVATFSYQNTFDPSRLIKFADGLVCAKNAASP